MRQQTCTSKRAAATCRSMCAANDRASASYLFGVSVAAVAISMELGLRRTLSTTQRINRLGEKSFSRESVL